MSFESSLVHIETFTTIPANGIITGTVGGFRNETKLRFIVTSESAGELFVQQSDNATPTENFGIIARVATRASGVAENTVAYRGGIGDSQLITIKELSLKGRIRCVWVPLTAAPSGNFTARIEVEYEVT